MKEYKIRDLFDYKSPKYQKRFCLSYQKRDDRRNIYKYMTIDTFFKCIKDKNIQFVEPSYWIDEYERRFYLADYSNITTDINITPKVYANCFTTEKVSDAAWSTYRDFSKGEEGNCVKLKIKRCKFSEQLCSANYKIYEGLVNYKLSDYEIINLHKKKVGAKGKETENEIYNSFIGEKSSFKLENYLNLLLIKRDIFRYEHEFRYFLIDNSDVDKSQNKSSCTPIYPYIKWEDCLLSVEVSSGCPEVLFKKIEDNVKQNISSDITVFRENHHKMIIDSHIIIE